MVRYRVVSFLVEVLRTDNALIAQEIIHHIHKSKSNQGLLAAKLDLEKAYDRVDWDFLEKTLDDFSFPARIVSLIVFCIRSSFFILWNGSKLQGFVPTRVLR